ncbi:NUDIX domain-containing protein [Deinococcus lacus]|uniref:NUDIX domain-containing protein n=1 Tax=Deinococcus lacus TaxID=392561 RepID=A0ABW1YBN2_9DEIO
MTSEAGGSPTQTIYEGRIVRLELLGGKYEVVRHADAIAVLALSSAGEMLCVQQFRPALGQRTLEVPAGLIEDGEDPAEAARREFQEEAGFDADMEKLTFFYASPGFCDEGLHIFHATNLRESRLPMDDDEDITVVWRRPAEVLDELRSGQSVGSATTVTAALFALHILAQQGAGQP